MNNQDILVARKYHQATKHSPLSIRQEGHYLDWENKPNPFKIYRHLEPIPLPRDFPRTGASASETVSTTEVAVDGEVVPDLKQIAHLLYYSAGVTKKMVFDGERIYFRAAACAGALYPIEIYLVCGDMPELEAGVYHFSPADFGLYPLRKGDFRGVVMLASGEETHVTHAPAVLVFTAITWRSSWKYRARSYRYHFWDNGTILANALAACAAQWLPHRVVMGFVDAEINHLLGIDGENEKSLALFPLGWVEESPPPAEVVPTLQLELDPLSREQVEYALIDELHQASVLPEPDEVREWREAGPLEKEIFHRVDQFPLRPMAASNYPQKSLEKVIAERGSSRRFELASISFKELSKILDMATRGFPADWRDPEDELLNNLYINIHAVDDLPSGAYYYRRDEKRLGLLGEGDFRDHSAHLCLGQPLGGSSSATVFHIADLEAILEKYGNRGYRLAQMEAGIIGGKLYLAAYALGRGATGLTFFDDDVVNFFLPENAREEAIFVTALGEPASPLQRHGQLVSIGPGDEVKY